MGLFSSGGGSREGAEPSGGRAADHHGHAVHRKCVLEWRERWLEKRAVMLAAKKKKQEDDGKNSHYLVFFHCR